MAGETSNLIRSDQEFLAPLRLKRAAFDAKVIWIYSALFCITLSYSL